MPKASSPMKLVVALCLLGLGGLVAFRGIFGASKPEGGVAPAGTQEAGDMTAAELSTEAELRVDLLAAHGSFVGRVELENPFGFSRVASNEGGSSPVGLPAAPGGPGAVKPNPRADELEKAQAAITVSMIFRAGAVRRAVVNGRIVGLGDVVEGLQVVEIEDAAIVVVNAGVRERYSLGARGVLDKEVKR